MLAPVLVNEKEVNSTRGSKSLRSIPYCDGATQSRIQTDMQALKARRMPRAALSLLGLVV